MVAASASCNAVFRAISDPTRRTLLDLLSVGERSVNELLASFRVSQPAISKHLRILRQARLVRTRAVGRQRLYRVNPQPIRVVHEWAARHITDPFGHVWKIKGTQ